MRTRPLAPPASTQGMFWYVCELPTPSSLPQSTSVWSNSVLPSAWLACESLSSLRDDAPSRDENDAMWGALSTKLLAAGVVSGAVASAATATGASATTALQATQAGAAASVNATAIAGTQAAGGKLIGWTALQGFLAPALSPKPTHAGKSAHVKPRRTEARATSSAGVDPVLRESELLQRARSALRADRLDEAAQLLSRLKREAPSGVLGQERSVVEIELAYAQGKRDEAARLARQFIDAHPRSPHSQKLRRFVSD